MHNFSSNAQRVNSIRGDQIIWLEDKSDNPFEQYYQGKLTRLIAYLNRTCYTSIKSFESHYANFSEGSFYEKHVDQFDSDKKRMFSVVLFCNLKELNQTITTIFN